MIFIAITFRGVIVLTNKKKFKNKQESAFMQYDFLVACQISRSKIRHKYLINFVSN